MIETLIRKYDDIVILSGATPRASLLTWPWMEAREKEKLLADLESGRQALLDILRGVTEDVAERIPAPGRWSILECVEHLRSKLTSHPIIGSINCHEALLMIVVHPHRHAKQIEEIKAVCGIL